MSQTSGQPIDDQDPAAFTTWLVGFVGLFMFIAIVLGVTALSKMMELETRAESMNAGTPVELQNLNDSEAERLAADAHREEYIDASGQVGTRIVIPLDDAIEMTLDTYGK